MATLTAADAEALSRLPCGWFRAEHLPFNRPMYRCERLEKYGKLQSRILGAYPNIWREYAPLDKELMELHQWFWERHKRNESKGLDIQEGAA